MKKPVKKYDHQDTQAAQALTLARRARLQALLFTGAAVGTTLVTLATVGPKLPPFTGE
jgi:hypothetical protein